MGAGSSHSSLCAVYSLEGHTHTKMLYNAANYYITLAGLLLDNIAINEGHNLQGIAATYIASCWHNSGVSITRQHGLQHGSIAGKTQ
jgi:hypothetical protein